MEWQPIATAPFDRDLEVAVINSSIQREATIARQRRRCLRVAY
jgi:hypothetical protein